MRATALGSLRAKGLPDSDSFAKGHAETAVLLRSYVLPDCDFDKVEYVPFLKAAAAPQNQHVLGLPQACPAST